VKLNSFSQTQRVYLTNIVCRTIKKQLLEKKNCSTAAP
jgi:hypothetical protein